LTARIGNNPWQIGARVEIHRPWCASARGGPGDGRISKAGREPGASAESRHTVNWPQINKKQLFAAPKRRRASGGREEGGGKNFFCVLQKPRSVGGLVSSTLGAQDDKRIRPDINRQRTGGQTNCAAPLPPRPLRNYKAEVRPPPASIVWHSVSGHFTTVI